MRRSILILFIWVLPLSPPFAQAYLLPGSFVFQKAVQPRSGLKSIEWMAKVTDLKANFVFQENLWVNFENGKVGAAYSSPLNEPLGSVQTQISNLSDFGKFWICIGLDPSMTRARKALQDLGVMPEPEEEPRLERNAGRVVLAWGENSRIQFEKDDFTPVQYRAGRKADSDLLLFQNHAIGSEKARIPKTVVFRSGGRDLYLFELKAIKVDLPVKDKASPSALQVSELKEWVSLVR